MFDFDYLKDVILKSNYCLWKVNISVKKNDTVFNVIKDTEKPMQHSYYYNFLAFYCRPQISYPFPLRVIQAVY